jgi:CBS domain-containing protein
MKVAQYMNGVVRVARPDDTIQQAARTMVDADAGILPVCDGERLVGIITDRDIAVRAVADGMGPDTKVRRVMTAEVIYCFDDDEPHDVLHNMGESKVRRLPVLNREKRLVGIVSLGDLAYGGEKPKAAEALHRITKPGGPHDQVRHGA